MAGRPTVRTEANKAIILAALKNGLTYRLAALTAGMSEDTLINWRQADANFSAKCEQARALFALKVLKRMAASGRSDTWLMERCFPKDYGNQIAITGADGGPLDVKTEIRFVWADDAGDHGGHDSH